MIERLRELRKNADLTQAQIAAVLHCAQRTYSGYECGTRGLPIDVLIKLAEYYHTSTDHILGISNERSNNKHSKTPR